MPDPIYTTLPIPGTGIRERVVLNDDDSVSRPTQAVFADSSGLNAEATQLAFQAANHTDIGIVHTDLLSVRSKLDTLHSDFAIMHSDLQAVIAAIGLLPQA